MKIKNRSPGENARNLEWRCREDGLGCVMNVEETGLAVNVSQGVRKAGSVAVARPWAFVIKS